MFIADGREFTDTEVEEFRWLRFALLETGSYESDSPEMLAYKAFRAKHGMTLGQLVALEKEHDKILGPDYFKRPPWTVEKTA